MSEKNFDFPSPRPWRIVGEAIRDREGVVIVSAMNPANMATRRLIVEAVNGKTEADAPAPLPFGMAEARDEANRRYQETRQEFWAGLADLLADAVAVEEYREADRKTADRLREELDEQKAVVVETGKQKLDALFEVSKLRNLVKRLLPYAEQRLAELHTPTTPFLVEARQALEEETAQ